MSVPLLRVSWICPQELPAASTWMVAPDLPGQDKQAFKPLIPICWITSSDCRATFQTPPLCYYPSQGSVPL